MENLDSTIVVTAIPQIADSFGVAPVNVNIGISAYILTLAVLIPVSGWIADRLGSRLVYTSAITIFTAGSILCGLSQNLPFFIFAEIFQGIGGAMMVPVGRLVVLRTTQKQDLIRAIATITWPGLIAPILGPPVGGFITTYFSWHWIFFLNVPLGVVAFFFVFKVIPKGHGANPKPFDLPGFLLTGLACFAFMFLLDLISRGEFALTTLLPWVAGTFVVGALAIWHSRRTPHPLLDLWALRLRSFSVTILGGSIFRLCIGSLPFLLPLLFQIGFGYSPFESGALVLAVFAGNFIMKIFTTAILRRFSFKKTLIVNGVLNGFAILGCALIQPDTPIFITALLLFISGLTRSMQFTALNTLAFSDVPSEHLSGANSLSSIVQQMTLGMGIAFGGALLRVGEWINGDPGGNSSISVSAFHLTFLAIGLISFTGLFDVFKLKPDAGDALRQGRPKAVAPAPQAVASSTTSSVKTQADLPEAQKNVSVDAN
ncbi:MAG: MFS transporter [Chloroflexi bacterium]|nr:MFS transporter [Chloroflexota bacterium]